MVQGPPRGQPQTNVAQPKRLTRFAGRLSPQQSLKRAGPAISEALRTSLRTRPREASPNGSNQREFRPDSTADAYLCLDKRAKTDSCISRLEPDSRTQKQVVDTGRSSVPTTRIMLPTGDRPNGRQAFSEVAATRGLRAQAVPVAPKSGRPREPMSEESDDRRGDTTRVRLPGILLQRQVVHQKRKRISKALPALPPPSPSPCPTSFKQSRQPAIDAFKSKGKVLRDRGSPGVPAIAVAPPMEVKSENSESSSGSSYDSAEQTWNMINIMMRAVGEEEIQRARESLIHTGGQRKTANARTPGAYVTFPRMAPPRLVKDVSSDSYNSSGRTNSSSSAESSPSRQAPRTFVRPRSMALSMKRHASETSIFSIVIQPTRELSREEQDALIAEDDLPSRIKGILQCTHVKPGLSMASRTSSVSSDEAGLHPDLALTIDALRSVSNVEPDDITFDSKDI